MAKRWRSCRTRTRLNWKIHNVLKEKLIEEQERKRKPGGSTPGTVDDGGSQHVDNMATQSEFESASETLTKVNITLSNLVFHGLEPVLHSTRHETARATEDCEAVVRSVLNRDMRVPADDVAKLRIVRANRLGKRKTAGKRNRQIIVKFETSRKTNLSIKYGKNLKGKQSGVSEDFPKENRTVRDKLNEQLNQSRKNNTKATILHPARLFIVKLFVRLTSSRRIPGRMGTTRTGRPGGSGMSSTAGNGVSSTAWNVTGKLLETIWGTRIV